MPLLQYGSQSDNLIFSAVDYVSQIVKHNQQIHHTSVGAKHQNDVAKCGIGQHYYGLYHLFTCCQLLADVADCSLWPMAVDYAIWLFKHISNATSSVAPNELIPFLPLMTFQHSHVWGCPTYILDPTLSDGQKIPKWQPHSCCAIFVGLAPCHTHTLPLILTCMTLANLPKYHIIFDDWFSTVSSSLPVNATADDSTSPSWWHNLFLHISFYYTFDDSDNHNFHSDFLSTQDKLFCDHLFQCKLLLHLNLLPMTNIPFLYLSLHHQQACFFSIEGDTEHRGSL